MSQTQQPASKRRSSGSRLSPASAAPPAPAVVAQQFITDFFKLEAASGILLVLAAVVAMILANSPLSLLYTLLIETPVVIKVGALELNKPLLLWVNDGLMAVFFFLVGLELKREFIEGELSDRRKIMLPALGALGGMAVPALIYTLFNYHDPQAMQGWAIPTATDIAFALGVLALLGSRVPLSLKVFLTSLAIFDDIGAILIIAFFYTSHLSALALLIGAICIATLFALNQRKCSSLSVYILVGIVLWVALLKSGVHATLAGIVLAMFIPMRSAHNPAVSPLKHLEHDLHGSVAFIILPVFAFCNAGISFGGMGWHALQDSVTLGIALGLLLGKQLGVFVCCWLGIALGWARLPQGMSMQQLYGASVLTGIGFTMSLFIGSLAFEQSGANLIVDERLGIILGSLVSGVLGYALLRCVRPVPTTNH